MITQGSRAAVRNFIATNDNYRTLVAGREFLKEGGEIPKYFTLNQTGNIMISSTAEKEADISENVKETFQKVIVFFGAWTVALNKKQKTLYDYDAIASIIGGSGLFIKMHEENRKFRYSSKGLTLNTAIISNVLSGFASMGGTTALSIARTVVGTMGHELTLSATNNQADKKIAHLLFVCENLLGMPIVSVLLFNTTANQSESVTKSNCHETLDKEVNMAYHQDTFMFVDPQFINKFTEDFKSNPDYEKLIDKLAESIN